MEKIIRTVLAISAMAYGLLSCQNDEVGLQYNAAAMGYMGGAIIVNEGNFNSGNASLSSYNPLTGATSERIFEYANGFGPGDVAQDLIRVGDEYWLAMNGSGKVWKLSSDFKVLEEFSAVGTPVQLKIFAEWIAVRDLYQNRIRLIQRITGEINVVEIRDRAVDIAVWNGSLYLAHQDGEVTQIDANQNVDAVQNVDNVRFLAVLDNDLFFIKNDGKITASDGAHYDLSLAPRITAVDENRLYFVSENSLYRWSAAENSPKELFEAQFEIYGLSVDPYDNELYLFDAKGFNALGEGVRIDASGLELDRFSCGIIPVKAIFP